MITRPHPTEKSACGDQHLGGSNGGQQEEAGGGPSAADTAEGDRIVSQVATEGGGGGTPQHKLGGLPAHVKHSNGGEHGAKVAGEGHTTGGAEALGAHEGAGREPWQWWRMQAASGLQGGVALAPNGCVQRAWCDMKIVLLQGGVALAPKGCVQRVWGDIEFVLLQGGVALAPKGCMQWVWGGILVVHWKLTTTGAATEAAIIAYYVQAQSCCDEVHVLKPRSTR